jgi:hypothetical protein
MGFIGAAVAAFAVFFAGAAFAAFFAGAAEAAFFAVAMGLFSLECHVAKSATSTILVTVQACAGLRARSGPIANAMSGPRMAAWRAHESPFARNCGPVWPQCRGFMSAPDDSVPMVLAGSMLRRVVVDGQTHRWRSELAARRPSGLLDWKALTDLQQTLRGYDAVLLVASAPNFGVKLIETVQHLFTFFDRPLMIDAEYWMSHPGAASATFNISRHPPDAPRASSCWRASCTTPSSTT